LYESREISILEKSIGITLHGIKTKYLCKNYKLCLLENINVQIFVNNILLDNFNYDHLQRLFEYAFYNENALICQLKEDPECNTIFWIMPIIPKKWLNVRPYLKDLELLDHSIKITVTISKLENIISDIDEDILSNSHNYDIEIIFNDTKTIIGNMVEPTDYSFEIVI